MKYKIYKTNNRSFCICKTNCVISLFEKLATAFGLIASIILCFKYLPNFWIVQIFLCTIIILLLVAFSKRESMSKLEFLKELKDADFLTEKSK